MSRWSDAGTWEGDGIRREAFFFSSGGRELYGSIYAATVPSRPFGVVACSSWGIEADRSDPLVRSVALAMANFGGAGLVFHYPGYGDSYGDPAAVSLTDLSDAARDAAVEASRRYANLTWILAGFMFGASVACLAQQQTALATLLLVQPSLRPTAYFQRLTKRSEPLASGPARRAFIEVGSTTGMAYGYPIPRHIVERSDEADAAVSSALEAFEGEGTVLRHVKPHESDSVPERFQQLDVPGTWRFASQNNPNLAEATIGWLDRRTRKGRG